MGKNKKPFIDRKTASVYHVVRRSQRDVGTEATAETLSDFVLMPAPENAAKEALRLQEREEERLATGNGGENTDVNDESEAGGAHTKEKKEAVEFSTLKQQIAQAGLLDQTAATYSKYTKPIHGTGTYISNETSDDTMNEFLTDASKNTLDTALAEAMAVHEVGRMLDSIALTPDCMEEDVARALFEEYEDGEYEEILDDFCLTANMEPVEEEDGNGVSFNFDDHIRQLMEKARAKENGGEVGGRELDDDFFSDKAPLHVQRAIEEDDEYDYEEDSLDREFNGEDEEFHSNCVNVTSDEEQKLLCQKFEETLLEYDSDDVGDLDDECDDIGGARPLEGDAQIEAALEEFLAEKEDEILIEGTKHLEEKKRCGGSGYSVLVGKTMVPANQIDALGENLDPSKTLLMNIEESKKQMQKELADADAILANPEMDLPPEEILIDGRSYFSATPRNPWDCESILSTYSNLDNNPVIIGRSSRSKKKRGKKKGGNPAVNEDESHAIPEDEPVKIQLSNKTGLPLGVYRDDLNQHPNPHDPDDEMYGFGEGDTFMSVNRGEARNKQESKMDKKMRKNAVKEERKICRMQKKMMKEAFKDEFHKRNTGEVVDAVGGTTVFRYS